MTRELYFEFMDSLEDRNQHQAPKFFRALMKLFCKEVHLQELYDLYIIPENRLLKFDLSHPDLQTLDRNFLNYANQLRIPHLILCANFKNDGEEEFSEYLAQIIGSMESMGLPDKVIKSIASEAEKNIEPG